MKKEKLTIFRSLAILFSNLIKGKVHFPKEYVGKDFTDEDGQEFTAFRHLKIITKKKMENSAAVFKVRFKFSGLPIKINKRLSLFPTPFLIAKPGFIEKIWTFNEDGYFQGIYQWETKEFAESYPQSFIFKMMTKRSSAGTLSFEVIPNTLLSNYVESLIN
jgi:hypothetical protein